MIEIMVRIKPPQKPELPLAGNLWGWEKKINAPTTPSATPPKGRLYKRTSPNLIYFWRKILDIPINHIVGIAWHRSVSIDGEYLNPEYSQKVRNHSPDGFDWGYSGSGPAQLALAILLQFTDKDTAVRLHQTFKAYYIAFLPMDKDFEFDLDMKGWISDQIKKSEDL